MTDSDGILPKTKKMHLLIGIVTDSDGILPKTKKMHSLKVKKVKKVSFSRCWLFLLFLG